MINPPFSQAKRKSVALGAVSVVALFILLSVGLNLWSSAQEIRTLSDVYASSGHSLGYSLFVPVAISIGLGGLLAWVAQYVWRKQSFRVAKLFLCVFSILWLIEVIMSWHKNESVIEGSISLIAIGALAVWVIASERRNVVLQ
jgi:hypothetical protein